METSAELQLNLDQNGNPSSATAPQLIAVRRSNRRPMIGDPRFLVLSFLDFVSVTCFFIVEFFGFGYFGWHLWPLLLNRLCELLAMSCARSALPVWFSILQTALCLYSASFFVEHLSRDTSDRSAITGIILSMLLFVYETCVALLAIRLKRLHLRLARAIEAAHNSVQASSEADRINHHNLFTTAVFANLSSNCPPPPPAIISALPIGDTTISPGKLLGGFVFAVQQPGDEMCLAHVDVDSPWHRDSASLQDDNDQKDSSADPGSTRNRDATTDFDLENFQQVLGTSLASPNERIRHQNGPSVIDSVETHDTSPSSLTPRDLFQALFPAVNASLPSHLENGVDVPHWSRSRGSGRRASAPAAVHYDHVLASLSWFATINTESSTPPRSRPRSYATLNSSVNEAHVEEQRRRLSLPSAVNDTTSSETNNADRDYLHQFLSDDSHRIHASYSTSPPPLPPILGTGRPFVYSDFPEESY
mmetsp:Transcript_21839/g.36146  ORF Transcript_21839/g.36146 Transcript_21839/m.36146 type:complete len:476 (+) Transcript_21839:275-1702(+)|eukprot:CAMPEP_0184665380 /NCGR_PEP_ID=MMETSP0308-20130426/56971_1 /TAXON_ID=38269 /ORGANISM="Gloeochaete witrockiana, Strain SAG 46.84" /LENGTH=475 /DNA_ID=CAMNT_0027109345 /DNA_START=208 /DNA_END=1635 /DNA_ORIENTATION=-